MTHTDAEILLPPSKSIAQRLLMVRALLHQPAPPKDTSLSADIQTLQRALWPHTHELDAGDSGTALRLLTAWCSRQSGTWHIKGSPRLLSRPMLPLINALKQLNGRIEYAPGRPITIYGGTLYGSNCTLNCTESSQHATALMLIAPTLPHGLRIQLIGTPVSMPYLLLTQNIMQQCGAQCYLSHHSIDIPAQPYSTINLPIEADWSAASYFYELLAAKGSGTLTLCGLQAHSLQGDRRIATLCEPFGITTHFVGDKAIISKNAPTTIKELRENCTDTPDLVPALAAMCCATNVPFCLTGCASLRHKESDRLSALSEALGTCGYNVQTTPDTLLWNGEQHDISQPIHIRTHNDHRIAMALVPLTVKHDLQIDNAAVVNKSFPDFFGQIRKAL